jgi:hypothetical protein
VDEQPLLGAIEPADVDQFVGAQRTADGVGDEGAELLFQRGGLSRPVDERGDPWEGQLQERSQELVEGLLPGAVVVDRLGHPARGFAGNGAVLAGNPR